MLKILFITFYFKNKNIEIIIKSLSDKVELYIIREFNDFKKMKDINFDYILTQLYWKINWASFIDKNKYDEIPDYIKYKKIIFHESNPISSLVDESLIYRLSIDNLQISKQKNKVNKFINDKKKKYGVEIKPYKGYRKDLGILILLQNYYNHFINMKFEEYENFIQNIITEIRNYSKNKIIVRYKIIKAVDDRSKILHINDPINNMEITGINPLQEDIDKSYVAIAHSTNAVLKVLFEGVHLISLSNYCLCDNYADHEIKDILNPKQYNRMELYDRILSCTWSYKEFEDGKLVKYLEKYSK